MPLCGGARGKAAPSRGARRNMNFSSAELDELVIASQLVPTGLNKSTDIVQKYSVDSEALSTADPSSAEQSPELVCMESELGAWPTLRQQELMGWDFCSDDSDNEEFWKDLPEPALAVEGTPEVVKSKRGNAPWVLVPESGSTESATVIAAGLAETDETASKTTLADLLRERQTDVRPPAAGAYMPPVRARPLQRRNGEAAAEPGIAKDQHTFDDSEQSESHKAQHGWKNQHKATWNAKQQRKVAEQKSRKLAQSCQSRGWLEDEDDLQDEA